jgi:2OG-Fe dioxygenase
MTSPHIEIERGAAMTTEATISKLVADATSKPGWRERVHLRGHCWRTLRNQGFALLTDTQLGFGSDFRLHVLSEYFAQLQPETYGVFPVDRLRACNALLRWWSPRKGLTLREKASVGFRTAPDVTGNHPHGMWREYHRVRLTDDPLMEDWIGRVFSMVPPRPPIISDRGCIRLDFFRTFRQVVSGPHSDGQAIVVIYVVDKHGCGAETTLHPAGAPDKVVFRHTLMPGEILVFDDRRLLHDVSPITPAQDGKSHRDVIVCGIQ